MKKMLSIALSTAMVLSLAGCGGSNKNASTTATEADKPADGSSEAASNPDALEPVTLTLYSPGNENSVPTKTILEYKKLVEEASGGKITLDAYHSGELGNDAEALGYY